MDHRPVRSEGDIRNAIRDAVVRDPRSDNLLANFPYIAISPVVGAKRDGDWQADYAEGTCPGLLEQAINEAAQTLQDELRLMVSPWGLWSAMQ